MVKLKIILLSTIVLTSPIGQAFAQHLNPKTASRLQVVSSLLDAAGPQRFDTDRFGTAGEAFDIRKCAKANAALAALPGKDPEARAMLHLAECALELGEYTKTISYAKRAIEMEPVSSRAHLLLGESLGLEAEQERSFLLARRVRREFEMAVELDSGNLSARRDLMEFYLAAPWFLGGSQSKAWEQAQAIARQDPLEGHLARAAFWISRRQPDRAYLEYRAVLELKPKRIEPYFAVAEFCEGRGDAADIEAAIQPASLIKPDDPRLGYYRGVASVLEGGRFEDAERFLKSYIAVAPVRSDFPPRAAADEWLGRLCEKWGRVQEAVDYYKAALRSDTHRPLAREALARLHAGR